MFSCYQIYDYLSEKIDFQLDYYQSESPSKSFDAKTLEKYELYAILWLKTTLGEVQVDFQNYKFESNTMLFLFPGQYFKINEGDFEIVRISFHRDFFCVRENNPQVLCNGVLFNHVYAVAHTFVDVYSQKYFETLHLTILENFDGPFHADKEKVISLLSKWLVRSVKDWTAQSPFNEEMTVEETDSLFLLKKAIDNNYLEKYSITEYAAALNTHEKTLSRLIKKRINKTISDLVNHRVILEAKRELIFTDKPVKEIALELSFKDVAYFVRFFKKYNGLTPQGFRAEYNFDVSAEYYLTIINLIEDNYIDQHNVQFYADQLHITPKTLLDQVKKKWNCTISDLIKKRLFLEAKRQLFFTEKKVREISNELRFSEPSSFSNFFKQYAQCSPEHFRNEWKSKANVSIPVKFRHFGLFDWVNKV